MKLSRRSFLVGSGQASVAALVGGCSRMAAHTPGVGTGRSFASMSPINRQELIESVGFGGDDPTLAHQVLRDRVRSFTDDQLPPPAERVGLVVVGGGLTGLTTAYLARGKQPLVLEQAPRLGGNSQGKSFAGIEASIGAAYFLMPDPDSDIWRLLNDLGIDLRAHVVAGDESVVFNGRVVQEFWEGSTDSKQKTAFRRMHDYLQAVWDESDFAYPEIPLVGGENDQSVQRLDQVTFMAELQRVNGGVLHPHIATLVEQYCWSSFGASSDELSAAAGLNFLAAEFGEKVALPGGNAGVTDILARRLYDRGGERSLRTGCLVMRVRDVGNAVWVSYLDSSGAVHTVAAEQVVLACPKFIVKRLMPELEATRVAAIDRLSYRGYLVANVTHRDKLRGDFYDRYVLGAPRGERSVRDAARAKGATDVISANYAAKNNSPTVLTLYRAFPYDGGRAELFVPGAYERSQQEFLTQINQEIFPALGLSSSGLLELNITRWGHPLPVAKQGFFTSGAPQLLAQPFGERIHFAEQDTWALPAFETALTEAFRVVRELRL